MQREEKTKEDLKIMINDNFKKVDGCERYRVDVIKRTEPDSDGCNWSVEICSKMLSGEPTPISPFVQEARRDEIVQKMRQKYNLK